MDPTNQEKPGRGGKIYSTHAASNLLPAICELRFSFIPTDQSTKKCRPLRASTARCFLWLVGAVETWVVLDGSCNCRKLLEDLTRCIHAARPAGAFGVRKCVLHFRELWIQFQIPPNIKIKKAPRSGEEPLFISILVGVRGFELPAPASRRH